MILLHFDIDDLKGCKSVKEVYNAFGIGDTDEYEVNWNDDKVFGKRGYVSNMFCTQDLYEIVSSLFEARRFVGHDGEEMTIGKDDAAKIFEWANFSPISTGPRYKRMLKVLRENTVYEDLPDNMIVIFTPEDDDYEEAPRLPWQEYL